MTTDWLDSLPDKHIAKYIALFKRLGDVGKIYDERKFKHLTETNQLFEFKVDDKRAICFFFSGRRVIVTHGFTKELKKEFESREAK